MMGHNICFHGEIWLIITKLSLLPLLIWSTIATEPKSVVIILLKDLLFMHKVEIMDTE